MKYFLFLFFNSIIYSQSFSQVACAEVISYNTSCQINKGNLSVTKTIKLKINNKAGQKYADFRIPYQKGEKITVNAAYLLDKNGNIIRKLKDKDMTDLSATQDALYQDFYYREFSLHGDFYPFYVNMEYTKITENFLFICDWSPVYDQGIPVHYAELNISVPLNFRVKIFDKNIEQCLQFTDKEFNYYKWTDKYENQIPEEIFSPPFEQLIPQVKVVPLKFNYGVEGDFSSWNTFGNWVYRLNTGLDDLPTDAKDVLKNLVAGKTTNIEKVKTIYHYMEDHMRYIDITIKLGGMKSYPASFVVDHSYGDCKALTNYMKSSLSFLGIKSYYTLIHASLIPAGIDMYFPSQEFNHMILTVPLARDTIFLENTSGINPFGYLGSMTQNRYALLISENDSHLIKTPSLRPADVRTERIAIVKFNSDNSAKADFSYFFRGYYFELFNELKNLVNKHDQDTFIRTNLDINNFEIDGWKIERPDRDTCYTQLLLKASNMNFIRDFGPFKLLGVFKIGVPSFETPSKRTLPVYIPYPYDMVDSTIYITGDTFMPENLPHDTTVISEYGTYSRKVVLKSGKLFINREFVIKEGSYPIDSYDSFYSFIETCRREENLKLLIK